MANQNQIEACVRKIARFSVFEARNFRALIDRADQLAFSAMLSRKQAWAIYHNYYEPKRKPPTHDNSDLI